MYINFVAKFFGYSTEYLESIPGQPLASNKQIADLFYVAKEHVSEECVGLMI